MKLFNPFQFMSHAKNATVLFGLKTEEIYITNNMTAHNLIEDLRLVFGIPPQQPLFLRHRRSNTQFHGKCNIYRLLNDNDVIELDWATASDLTMMQNEIE